MLGPWGIEDFAKDLTDLVETKRQRWQLSKDAWEHGRETAVVVTREYNLYLGAKAALDLYNQHLEYASQM